jgi:hypothetical protein
LIAFGVQAELQKQDIFSRLTAASIFSGDLSDAQPFAEKISQHEKSLQAL